MDWSMAVDAVEAGGVAIVGEVETGAGVSRGFGGAGGFEQDASRIAAAKKNTFTGCVLRRILLLERQGTRDRRECMGCRKRSC
jgi:hypothetical protein